MYQKGAKGWLKHFDFMLLDLIVLQLSFLVAFQIRHGMVNPYANRDYLALAIITELADIVAMIFLNTYEGVIRRGYFKEFISSFKNGFVIVALLLLYVCPQGYIYIFQNYHPAHVGHICVCHIRGEEPVEEAS